MWLQKKDQGGDHHQRKDSNIEPARITSGKSRRLIPSACKGRGSCSYLTSDRGQGSLVTSAMHINGQNDLRRPGTMGSACPRSLPVDMLSCGARGAHDLVASVEHRRSWKRQDITSRLVQEQERDLQPGQAGQQLSSPDLRRPDLRRQLDGCAGAGRYDRTTRSNSMPLQAIAHGNSGLLYIPPRGSNHMIRGWALNSQSLFIWSSRREGWAGGSQGLLSKGRKPRQRHQQAPLPWRLHQKSMGYRM